MLISVEHTRASKVADFNLHGIAYPEDVRQSSESSRIVNGYPASLGQFPYQVRIRMKKGPHKYAVCGGSILSKTVVLTAGNFSRTP